MTKFKMKNAFRVMQSEWCKDVAGTHFGKLRETQLSLLATDDSLSEGADARTKSRNLVAVAMSVYALLAVTSQSVRSEDVVQSDIESEFAAAVSRVASLRETNRSTAIVVTNIFKEITDKHQLSGFETYMATHYKLLRTKDVVGNVEFVDIDSKSLRKFDRRFFRQNTLRIGLDTTLTGSR